MITQEIVIAPLTIISPPMPLKTDNVGGVVSMLKNPAGKLGIKNITAPNTNEARAVTRRNIESLIVILLRIKSHQ